MAVPATRRCRCRASHSKTAPTGTVPALDGLRTPLDDDEDRGPGLHGPCAHRPAWTVPRMFMLFELFRGPDYSAGRMNLGGPSALGRLIHGRSGLLKTKGDPGTAGERFRQLSSVVEMLLMARWST